MRNLSFMGDITKELERNCQKLAHLDVATGVGGMRSEVNNLVTVLFIEIDRGSQNGVGQQGDLFGALRARPPFGLFHQAVTETLATLIGPHRHLRQFKRFWPSLIKRAGRDGLITIENKKHLPAPGHAGLRLADLLDVLFFHGKVFAYPLQVEFTEGFAKTRIES